jgi:hypothetical protein
LSGDPITSAIALPLEIRFTELVIRPYPGRSASDCPGRRAQAVKRIAVRRLNGQIS